MKYIKDFTAKAKFTSNLTTTFFIAYMAYTFSKWHRITGFDRLINLLIIILIIAINIKFYLIYTNLSSFDKEAEAFMSKKAYKQEKREYNNLVRAALWMGVALLIGKVLLI
ncbi:MAG: hypothetical protein K0Q65_383 [Clostridia bacterium]|nr:hypothetical protein [Clostridia bacterium]